MNAERFGSYSSRSTVAGTSHVRRLKSMIRYFCLWPPAMPREVTWPLLLRPPVFRLPSVSDLTGLPFHSADLSTRIRPRRAGEVGLLLQCHDLDSARNVDRVALCEGDDRLLAVRPSVGTALPLLGLALGDDRVDAGHLDVEQRLDGRLDFGLRRGRSDLEHHRILVRQH